MRNQIHLFPFCRKLHSRFDRNSVSCHNLLIFFLKLILKIHFAQVKYMTSHADSEDIRIDQQKVEK